MRLLNKSFSYVLSRDSVYIYGILGANALNLLFNLLVGRALTFEDFAIVTLISSLSYLSGILLTSLSVTVTHRISYLIGKGDTQETTRFYHLTRSYVFKVVAVYIVLWLLMVTPLSHFFDLDDFIPLLIFLPVLPLGAITSTNRGYLNGNLALFSVGLLTFSEAAVKIIIAIALLVFRSAAAAYIAIPVSAAFATIFSLYLVRQRMLPTSMQVKHTYFPRKFFIASLAAGFSTSAFLALDVLVAKHYLNPTYAGEYAFLALMGKIIYFWGSLFMTLIISYVSRGEGKGLKKNKAFEKLFMLSLGMTIIPYIGIGWFGKWTLPVLFGEKVAVIVPYLSEYALAIALFTVSIQIISYYLARRKYVFPIVTLGSYVLMVGGIVLFHSSMWDIVHVMFVVSVINMIGLLSMHLFFKSSYKKMFKFTMSFA